jgi:hypothetical protein
MPVLSQMHLIYKSQKSRKRHDYYLRIENNIEACNLDFLLQEILRLCRGFNACSCAQAFTGTAKAKKFLAKYLALWIFVDLAACTLRRRDGFLAFAQSVYGL